MTCAYISIQATVKILQSIVYPLERKELEANGIQYAVKVVKAGLLTRFFSLLGLAHKHIH